MTQSENARRGNGFTGLCPQGHPYNEENTYIEVRKNRSSPRARCRTCISERGRRYRSR